MSAQQHSSVLLLISLLFGISAAVPLRLDIAEPFLGAPILIPPVRKVPAEGVLPSPVVNPPVGKILGSRRSLTAGTEVYAFTGIPFAQPPIGDLRYRKPKPVAPWGDTTLDGTKTPPSCMQVDVFKPRGLVWVPYGEQKSEDCLYLNIWTPTLNASSLLPVMAWIHGGRFQQGSAAMHMDDGANLAALGKVVVVTIAYRLQSYGFLYDGTDDGPGNQGLYDQRLALQWIQDNVAAFGGDSAEVTLFGFSAGGVSTGYHLLSHGSHNLFKRAIIQSGPSIKKNGAKEQSQMLKYATEFAQIFGCSNGSRSNISSVSVSCLRNVRASLISAVEETFVDGGSGVFAPIFGDEFLPVDPGEATFPGDKDVIIGHLADEGSIMLYNSFRDTFSEILPPRKINKLEMIHFLGTLYPNLSLPDLLKLQDVYMGEIGDYDYERLRHALVDTKGDEHVICATYENAAKLFDATASAAGSNSVYFYKLNYVSSCNKRQPWFGMTHGDDTPFVFGRPFDLDGGCAGDIPFSKAVIDIWSDFSNGRVPTGPTGVQRGMFMPEAIEIFKITNETSAPPNTKMNSRCNVLKELGLY